MRRTEQAQGLRLMKFEEVYGRLRRGVLSQAEAAEVLGMSERNFRRWRTRYEVDGAEGLYDRRLGRVSARRAAVDEVMAVLELFDTRYWDFGVKHLYETLVAEHGFRRSYNWLRITLQAHGRIRPAPRRGAHRRKRPRRPMVGMMLHQDGSRHEWIAGETWDLIVTMDDATSEIYSAFFVAEEGTMSTFRGLHAVIAERGLFCSLYADRGSHYWHTLEAGGKVDRDNPTQVGRALARLASSSSRPTRRRPAAARNACSEPFRSACRRSCASPESSPWRQPTASSRTSICRAITPRSPALPRMPARRSCRSPATSRISSAFRRSGSSATTTRCVTRTASCRSPPTATVTTTSR
jgi:Winged helix-turn helix